MSVIEIEETTVVLEIEEDGAVLEIGASVTIAQGEGSGDVVGPAGATASRIAVFSGTTGKLLADGGATVPELQAATTAAATAASSAQADATQALADAASASSSASTHAASTSNPHSVTAAQAGALATPSGTPAEGDVVTYAGGPTWAAPAAGVHAIGFLRTVAGQRQIVGTGWASFGWSDTIYHRLELSTPLAPAERVVHVTIRQPVEMGGIGYTFAYEAVRPSDSAADQARFIVLRFYDEAATPLYLEGFEVMITVHRIAGATTVIGVEE